MHRTDDAGAVYKDRSSRAMESVAVFSVIDLLISVRALIVMPVHKHGSMVQFRATFSPSLETQMGTGQGIYGRGVPGKLPLHPILSETDDGVSIAIPSVVGFFLFCDAHMKDADRTHKIKCRPTDIDIRSGLDAFKLRPRRHGDTGPSQTAITLTTDGPCCLRQLWKH